jgi:hypothetical protein
MCDPRCGIEAHHARQVTEGRGALWSTAPELPVSPHGIDNQLLHHFPPFIFCQPLQDQRTRIHEEVGEK